MKQARKKKRPLARWRYFTAATRILRRAFKLAGITKFKKRNMKGKYKKDSGRSSKVTPSCNCVVFGDKSALKKNSLVVYLKTSIVHAVCRSGVRCKSQTLQTRGQATNDRKIVLKWSLDRSFPAHNKVKIVRNGFLSAYFNLMWV